MKKFQQFQYTINYNVSANAYEAEVEYKGQQICNILYNDENIQKKIKLIVLNNQKDSYWNLQFDEFQKLLQIIQKDLLNIQKKIKNL